MAFSIADRELRDDFFCLENSVQIHKAKKEGSSTKNSKISTSSNPCFNFYSEAGCTRDPCRYTHKCCTCDSLGHSNQKCKKATGVVGQR